MTLEPPRYEETGPMIVVGLSRRHTVETSGEIAAQWRAFMARFEEVLDKAPSIPLGVSTVTREGDGFEYLCGVEVTHASHIPDGMMRMQIPPHRWAVFTHRGHVSSLAETHAAIWTDWPSASAYRPAEGPCLERHCRTFDPRTGLGGVELWIPLSKQ